MIKQNKWKKMLAIALALVLTAVSSGSTIFASEEGVSDNAGIIGTVEAPQETVPEAQTPVPETVPSVEAPAEETVSSVEAPVEETVSPGTADTEENAGSTDDTSAADEKISAPDGANEVAVRELKNEINELKAYKAGIDYVEHQAYFAADSKEEAEKVAAEYGAVLDSYEYGVAVISFDGNVEQVLNRAADTGKISKPVYPDYIVHAYDTAQIRVPRKTLPMNVSLDPASMKEASSVKKLDLNSALGGQKGGTKETADLSVADDAGIKAVYTDPHYADGWQWFHEEIKTASVHADGVTGKGIKVAVIDTGITTGHEEFTGRYKGGYDFVNSDSDPADDNGHGTHCAGIIGAAGNNGKGGVGVAPEVDLYAYKVLNSQGSGSTSSIVKAVNKAVEDGVNVISMSLGGGSSSTDFQSAINAARKKGVVVVAAAGNESTSDKSYPAAYDNVLSVAAMQDKGSQTLSWFSNYGNWVDVVAPGGGAENQDYPTEDGSNAKTEIFSTYYRTLDNKSSTSGYYCMSGTSMACPVVAGLVALVMSSNDKLMTGNEGCTDAVTNIICSNTDGLTYTSTYSGGTMKGKVLADAAVEAAKNTTDLPVPNGKYSIVDAGGFAGEGHICIGSSMQLRIFDEAGEVKGAAAKAKWTSSNENVMTVKAGKVVCSKNAQEDDKVTITASYDDTDTTFEITVEQKFAIFGINRSKPMVENRWLLLGKIFGSQPVYASVGTSYSLTDPNALLTNYGECCLYYVKSKTRSGTYYGSYDANAYFKYKISVPAKAVTKGNISVVSTQENGDASAIVFNKPGTYVVKYKTTDGSSKAFTVKFLVYNLTD